MILFIIFSYLWQL